MLCCIITCYKKLFRNKANVPADLQSAGIKYKDL